MSLQIRKLQRSQKPLKVGVKGPSGSGKTYSAGMLAKGLVDPDKRVCVIESEDGGFDLYDSDFDFDIIPIGSSASGRDYIEALELVLSTGDYGLVIIDSLSHDWESVIHRESQIDDKNMKSWAIAKNDTGHRDFLEMLWAYPLDIICTIRCDEAFEVAKDDQGHITKRKIGFKPIQQPRLEYNFDIVFDVQSDTHIATTAEYGKNRTPLWQGDRFVITEAHGKQLRDWKLGGSEWIEPIRTATQKAIGKYVVGLGMKDTWRDLMDIPADRSLSKLGEEEAQKLLAILKDKNKENKDAKAAKGKAK